jgi:1-acyl-sn-glycerol-3-phosphate acyltransferase
MITVDLLLWIPFLVFFALLKAVLPIVAVKRTCDACTDECYRTAVRVNAWLLEGVLGLKFNVIGQLPQGRLQRMLVISNQRSWFDILALQTLIVPRGPIIKFLIKKELIYVPVVGWICLALNFPRLTRGQQPGGREKDFDSVTSAVMELDNSPFALLNFIEGTRFTSAKRDSNTSRYQHLLNPKTGGFRIMPENLPHADIIDVTLIYPREMNFWECLSGRLKQLDVHVSCSKADDISDINQWVNARWDEKEALHQANHARVNNRMNDGMN